MWLAPQTSLKGGPLFKGLQSVSCISIRHPHGQTRCPIKDDHQRLRVPLRPVPLRITQRHRDCSFFKICVLAISSSGHFLFSNQECFTRNTLLFFTQEFLFHIRKCFAPTRICAGVSRCFTRNSFLGNIFVLSVPNVSRETRQCYIVGNGTDPKLPSLLSAGNHFSLACAGLWQARSGQARCPIFGGGYRWYHGKAVRNAGCFLFIPQTFVRSGLQNKTRSGIVGQPGRLYCRARGNLEKFLVSSTETSNWSGSWRGASVRLCIFLLCSFSHFTAPPTAGAPLSQRSRQKRLRFSCESNARMSC